MNDAQHYRMNAVEMCDWKDSTDAAHANITHACENFQRELPAKVIDETLNGKTRNDFDPEEMKLLADNGIGAPVGVFAQAKSGLGTSIVNALAQQLDAKVEVLSGPSGTAVSVSHTTFSKVADTKVVDPIAAS
jgi:two-component sensor histidine kinase